MNAPHYAATTLLLNALSPCPFYQKKWVYKGGQSSNQMQYQVFFQEKSNQR